ncbi:MAG: cytochrome [Chitinophagaceae bacterium]|nr:cytochrome [Chitinophagaceae bacterium]
MTHSRRTAKTSFLSFLLLFVFSFNNIGNAQDGKKIFVDNCASCHAVNKKLTGPALAGVRERGPWADPAKLHAWVHNPAGFMAGDPYTQGLKVEMGGAMMTPFPNLSDKEIDAVVDYVEKAGKATANPVNGAPATQQAGKEDGDNTLLFGILTLLLAVISLILLQVNSNLKKLADDKEGERRDEPIPFWRNKAYIAVITVILFLLGGYWVVEGAIGLGRTRDYQPVQPIFYSHKVHAGVNQISCLYCHNGTEQGKQANIPSLNVCMNCHMAINEYKGAQLYRADGEEVNGTAEIEKIYKYVGFTPGKNANTWNMENAKPVEWVRIHSLPDHVYFNHSQHVKAGKVQCQTCHGEIQKMDEVKQFAELSMGWCVNCHRETKVQFKSNGFYSIYEKYHDDLKNGRIDTSKGITVEKIGGTECQKCHY